MTPRLPYPAPEGSTDDDPDDGRDGVSVLWVWLFAVALLALVLIVAGTWPALPDALIEAFGGGV